MNRLSLAPVTVNDLGPLDLIDAAHHAGFDSTDLRVVGAPGAAPVAPLIGEKALIAAIAGALADTGVTLFAATGLWLLPDFDLDAGLPALEIAARLGVEQFLAVGNDPDEGRMTDNLGRLADAADSFGLRLALELMPYTAVNSLAKAHRMVRACDRANLGLLIDALHLARAGGTPDQVAAIPAQDIAYLQLCDAPKELPPAMTLRAESLGARLYPGDGALPLFELMNALPTNIVVDVETPVASNAHLSGRERATLALFATQHFLTAWRAQKTIQTIGTK
jgi:sugar phosphate isomerase/epimerase